MEGISHGYLEYLPQFVTVWDIFTRHFLLPMCQDVPSPIPNITATKDKLWLCCAKRGAMCVCIVWVSMRACVSLPPAALTVSRLCWGLSKQSCSQKLLPSLTEQEVDCFVSQGEPLRPRRCCLPLVWLWTHHLVQAISGQSTRSCAVSVRIHTHLEQGGEGRLLCSAVYSLHSPTCLSVHIKYVEIKGVSMLPVVGAVS